MSKQRNICLSGNNSTLQTTLSHETGKIAFRKVFSWKAAAEAYQALSIGLEEITSEDAKGYTKVLLLFIAAIITGGMLEGGEQ